MCAWKSRMRVMAAMWRRRRSCAIPPSGGSSPVAPSRAAEEGNRPVIRMMVARLLCAIALLPSAAIAQSAAPPARTVAIDVRSPGNPLDRFFDLSVGSDYPGTLIRPDAQAQLRLAVDELGFRYIRFHAIFHDVLRTVRVVNGRTVYDWSGIDRLYDDLLH